MLDLRSLFVLLDTLRKFMDDRDRWEGDFAPSRGLFMLICPPTMRMCIYPVVMDISAIRLSSPLLNPDYIIPSMLS